MRLDFIQAPSELLSWPVFNLLADYFFLQVASFVLLANGPCMFLR